MNQHEESLLFKFFKAQMESPTKGDWVSEVKAWIFEYEIATSLKEVSKMKKNIYEKIVKEKVEAEAFTYLKNKIKSKGSLNKYGSRLETQNYMKPNIVLKFQDQVDIFSYRSEMNDLKCNFKGMKEEELCLCSSIMNNVHLFECKELNNGELSKYKYEDLLNGSLHQLKYLLNIMKKNLAQYRKITLATRADN